MSELPKYIGRTIDVLAWRGAKTSGEVLLTASLADENSTGEICTGLQKLAQRWLITFLMEKGSKKYDPDAGTTFMTKLRQGRIRNETDLRAAFALAELATRGQMLAEEKATDPLDERYRSATLTAIRISPGFVSMTVRLQSRGDAVSIILPISTVV